MTGYCVKGEKQEKECSEARAKILRKNNGKLPEKYQKTTSKSCLYCPSWMS